MLCRDQDEQAQVTLSLERDLRALGQELTVQGLDAGAAGPQEGRWLLTTDGLMSRLAVPVNRQAHLPWRVIAAGADADWTMNRTAPPADAPTAQFMAQVLSEALLPGFAVHYTPGETSLKVFHEPILSRPSAPLNPESSRLWKLRHALGLLLDRHGIQLRAEERAFVDQLTEEQIEALCRYIDQHRSWPPQWP